MFKHILVPLDGSSLAESVILPVVELAAINNAKVTLIHIIEENPPETVHGESHLTSESDAKYYLEKVKQDFERKQIAVKYHVHSNKVSNVAQCLVDHAREFDHDTIALCTHGESGWRSKFVGTIAQQVIGLGKLPVLLIQPVEDVEEARIYSKFSKFLLALDGNDEHEFGVEKSVQLAKVINAELHLLSVVETLFTLKGSESATGILLPTATSALLDMAEEEAMERLESKAEKWRAEGLRVSIDVHRGDPVQWIVKDAYTHDCNLIVLGTHGRSGMQAFWSGSSAPKIPGLTKIPLLLIPVHHHN